MQEMQFYSQLQTSEFVQYLELRHLIKIFGHCFFGFFFFIEIEGFTLCGKEW